MLVERVGRFGARPAQGREQPVGGVRLVFGVEQGLHDLAQGRGVPEPGAGARPGGRPGQNSLGFLLPGAGGFRRVLVPRMPGRDPAHPGAPPLGRPLLHGPLRPLDHPSDDAHVDATGGVQDRLGLHPHQHMIVGTLPPPRPGRRSPSGATPTRTPPPHPKQHRKPTKHTIPFHASRTNSLLNNPPGRSTLCEHSEAYSQESSAGAFPLVRSRPVVL